MLMTSFTSSRIRPPLSGCSFNHGQACSASSRIFVHEKIYDEFLRRFTERAKSIKLGDPFGADTFQGPQVSQQQYDVRIITAALRGTLFSAPRGLAF